MVNSYRRFPRAKLLRRLRGVQDELGAWLEHYRRTAQEQDSRFTSELLYERAIVMDHWWHEVDRVADMLESNLGPLGKPNR
jgi:hypothetical protein